MDTRETEEAVYVRIIDYKSGKDDVSAVESVLWTAVAACGVSECCYGATEKNSILEKRLFRQVFFTIEWMIRWWMPMGKMKKKSWSIF